MSNLFLRRHIYGVSQEECAKLWENVPYVKLYRYNTKTYVKSTTVTEIMAREKCGRHRFRHTVGRPWRHTCPMRRPDQLDMLIQWPWRVRYSELVTCEVQTGLLFFPKWKISICILCTDFVMAMHVLLFMNIKGVFPIEGFHLEEYLCEFTRHCVILVLFRVSLHSEREVVRTVNTRENILQMVQRSPRLSTRRMASRIGVIPKRNTKHSVLCKSAHASPDVTRQHQLRPA